MLRIISGDRADHCTPADPFLLVSEADHRIANSLTLICGLIRTKASALRGRDSVPADEVSAALREIAGQVETVARLSRLLSHRPGDDGVNVCAHLHDVCSMLSETLGDSAGMKIKMTGGGECLMAQDKALPVALIVNELVTNAIKYAHPTCIQGRVHVRLDQTMAGGAVLTVADDGVGFPEDFDPTVHGGLGFRVIRALCGQLGGAYRFESGPLGVTFRLEVPL